ncbi:exocyst complex component EXO70B1-like [Panicum miliaceum]|uniref:Exocyst subunit Exo70 family protein n=1 Tax=Panicum miliaceum TaxID=4540 RepID=A0A3L6PD34_PANMI|nr:exocyst complex component EXO70B1-like [Panicum miliaceum]
MESWIKALKTMVQVLCITQLELRAKWPAAGGVRKAVRYLLLLATGKAAEREQEAALLARFAEASVLRMLDFVDAVADAALIDDDQAAAETLPGMLQVYACVVDDSPAVLALFKEAPGAASTFDAMNGVFLRKRSKLSDAVWSMVEKVRASFMADDCWRVSPAEAGGVHETARLMMNYAMLLWRNEGALNLVLQDQQHRFRMFLSEHDGHCSSSVADLIKNMISSSEKQLEKASNFISDPGSRPHDSTARATAVPLAAGRGTALTPSGDPDTVDPPELGPNRVWHRCPCAGSPRLWASGSAARWPCDAAAWASTGPGAAASSGPPAGLRATPCRSLLSSPPQRHGDGGRRRAG